MIVVSGECMWVGFGMGLDDDDDDGNKKKIINEKNSEERI